MDDSGLIFAIKGNALDDGPGIRTVVFFKGCPLSCGWCHNPEGRRGAAELVFHEDRCIGCGACSVSCPNRNPRPGALKLGKCDLCFTCVESCPAGALEAVGRRYSVQQVLEQVDPDRPFFRASGGGVTLSGGEPTVQMGFAGALSRALSERAIHVLLETCGHFPLDRFDEALYPHLGQIYFDLKLADAEDHRVNCGVDNDVIRANFDALARRSREGGVPLLPRVPLVPDVTATGANLRGLARWILDAGLRQVALVPYNPMWREKAARSGHATDLASGHRLMDKEALGRCRAYVEDEGVEVVE